MATAFDVAAGEHAGHAVQDVRSRVLVVAVVADQPGLDDVDVLLPASIDNAGDRADESLSVNYWMSIRYDSIALRGLAGRLLAAG
jgi:hypothetical protein